MVEPRDFHRFLETAERLDRERDPEEPELDDIRSEIDALSGTLPEPESTRRVVAHSLVRLALALLPILMWAGLGYGPFHVLVLFCLEGVVIGGANGLRILLTAASPSGETVARRLWLTASYIGVHTALVLALSAGVWLVFAPTHEIRALLTSLDREGVTRWILQEGLSWPLLGAAALLLSEVAGRSDYIDAYLPLGPATVARYGYTRPIAMFCFVVLSILLAEAGGSEWGTGLRFTTIGAVLLVVLRAFFDILYLWIPLISRKLFKGAKSFADWARHQKRHGQ